MVVTITKSSNRIRMVGEDTAMIVNPQFRKCVTFLYVDKKDEDTGQIRRVPAASAFFVSVPLENRKDSHAVYIVTARHVIGMSRPYGRLFARLNLQGGKFIDVETSQDNWIQHLDTDVAVIPTLLPKNPGFRTIPIDLLADSEFIEKKEISEGDEIFFSGLFQAYPGIERMQPILRFGNISLMPYEKVPVKITPGSDVHTPIDAYLVESRSWGGNSGSPAFIYFPANRKPGLINIGPTIYKLLGLVSGHYEIPRLVKFVGDILGKGAVDINTGIAVIIPSEKIIEVLESEKLVEHRNLIQKNLNELTPTPSLDSTN